jgi:hypothetical protein
MSAVLLVERSLVSRTERAFDVTERGYAPHTSPSASPFSSSSLLAAPTEALRGTLARVFLPRGRVADEYVFFQLMDSLQGTCSYLRGVLTIHATLVGVGVGSESASALAATLSFLLKDGAAMVGQLVFSAALSLSLDAEVKFWRLFADVINDVGLTLELLAPLAGPAHFLHVSCAANVCKALCGVAAGATRVAISTHFALEQNVAEVQAKEGSQECAVTLLGLGLGLLLAPHLNASFAHQAVAFALLTLVHVVANYLAVRSLALRTLNRGRIAVQARHLMPAILAQLVAPPPPPPAKGHAGAAAAAARKAGASSSSVVADGNPKLVAVSPQAAASAEPLFPVHYRSAVDELVGTLRWLVTCGCVRALCKGRGRRRGSSGGGGLHHGTSAGRPAGAARTSTTTLHPTRRLSVVGGDASLSSSSAADASSAATTDMFGDLRVGPAAGTATLSGEGMRLRLGCTLARLRATAQEAAREHDRSHAGSQAPWTWHACVVVSAASVEAATGGMPAAEVVPGLPRATHYIASLGQLLRAGAGGGGAGGGGGGGGASSSPASPTKMRRQSVAGSPAAAARSPSPSPSPSAHTLLLQQQQRFGSPQAAAVASAINHAQATGTPLDGFVVSASGLWPHACGGGGPRVSVAYFEGAVPATKLAAYLVAATATHMGGLTATLAVDGAENVLETALRAVLTAGGRGAGRRGHGGGGGGGGGGGDGADHPGPAPLSAQFIASLQRAGWDTEGLQLAEDGYRLSLLQGDRWERRSA